MGRGKGRGGGRVWLPRGLASSPAARKLSANAFRVLLAFYEKRRMTRVKYGGRNHWEVANNGEIVFPYTDAQQRLGLAPASFTRAIDALVACGFIDIAEPGQPCARKPTQYAISDRWMKYGLPDFVAKERPKETRRYGFQRQSKRSRSPSRTEGQR